MMALTMTTSVVMTMMLLISSSDIGILRLFQLTIAPQLGRSGLKKADVFPALLIGHHHHHQKSSSHPLFLLTMNYALRSLMEIPGLDPVREHFNLFPGTRESCVELLKWVLSFFSFSLGRRYIYLNLEGTVRCWG